MTDGTAGSDGLPSVVPAKMLSSVTSSFIPVATLAEAAEELAKFTASPAGQELLVDVYRCYKDVEKMAQFSRGRARAAGAVTSVGGALAIGGGAALAVGAIAATGGLATPAVLGGVGGVLLTGGSVAMATASITHVTNALVGMGWNAVDARKAVDKMEHLREKLQAWDELFAQVLSKAAETKGAVGETAADAMVKATTGTASAVSGVVDVAPKMAQAAVFAKDTPFLANTFQFMGVIGFDPASHCSATASAIAGIGASSSVVAQQLFVAMSGVNMVVGVFSVLSGLRVATGGTSEDADLLDAQADSLCVLLHTMLRMARGTPAHDEVADKVPPLLAVEIHSVRTTRPDYRLGDLTFCFRNLFRKWDAYFAITLCGTKRVRVAAPPVGLRARWTTKVYSKLLTRVMAGDTSILVQTYAKRALVHRATMGNAAMGPAYNVPLNEPCSHKMMGQTVSAFCCLPASCGGRICEIELSAKQWH